MRPVVWACVYAVALLVSACGGGSGSQSPEPTAACGEIETPAVQGGEHLIGGQDPPVPYSSTPPTSGWHASGAFDIGIRGDDDPLTEAQQVSVLEAGGVVVTHHGIGEADRRALEDFVAERYDGRVAVTPYDALEPGATAMTGWGVVQRCDGVDLEAVAAFADTYADEEPAVPGAHT